MWNGKEDPSGRFTEPPVNDPGVYIHRDADDYLTVNEISKRLSRVLRHQIGKATVVGRSGRQRDILPCNEGGWVNINDVMYSCMDTSAATTATESRKKQLEGTTWKKSLL